MLADTVGTFDTIGRLPPSLSELFSFCSELLRLASPSKLKPNDALLKLTSAELSDWLSLLELPLSLLAFRLRFLSREKGSASVLAAMVMLLGPWLEAS